MDTAFFLSKDRIRFFLEDRIRNPGILHEFKARHCLSTYKAYDNQKDSLHYVDKGRGGPRNLLSEGF